jgi:hypothetical protein
MASSKSESEDPASVETGERVRFYTDENIQRSVVRQLRKHGVDVLRCQEAGKRTAGDLTHLELATEAGRVLITRDDDFLRLNKQWLEAGRDHCGIMFVTPGKWEDIGAIVKDAILIHAALKPQEMYNQVWFV